MEDRWRSVSCRVERGDVSSSCVGVVAVKYHFKCMQFDCRVPMMMHAVVR